MRGHETPENHPLTILKGFSTVSEEVLGKGGRITRPRVHSMIILKDSDYW
jgi:hypothetical protein